jgi:hypothetical protein
MSQTDNKPDTKSETPPDVKPPANYLSIAGYAVNPDHITMFDLRHEDVIVHVAQNCLVAQGPDADKLRAMFPHAVPPAAKAAEEPPILAPVHKPEPAHEGKVEAHRRDK